MDKSKYQLELEALPEWVQKMVLACQHVASHGFGSPDHMGPEARVTHTRLMYDLPSDKADDFSAGYDHMRELAEALSAPYPPPPAPAREKRAFNVVELMDDDEEGGGFDQPCAFGNRCGGHAVYCHNEAWPNSPRKCRRSWYTGGATRDEDCPGYVANPDYSPPTPGERPP
jgi:hypothetical protein